MSEMTVIEINGVKMEVDLRNARRIDEIRVGDRVKVLVKQYDGYVVHAGVVIGFEPFEKRPTIIVAYVAVSYKDAELKFLHFNHDSKEIEIVKAIDDDQIDLSEAEITKTIGRKIAEHEASITDLRAKLDYLKRNFRAYWSAVSSESET